MRINAQTIGNIDAFEEFLNVRVDDHPDELLEVVRFLGIFPSYRSPLIFILSKWNSQNIYYDFQAYSFLTYLRSINESPNPLYTDILDDLHRRYLVNVSLYWQNRVNSNYYQTFKSAVNAGICYKDLTSYILYLINMYPLDPQLRQTYAEISLIALGEPSLSAESRRLAAALRDSSNIVDDPLLKKIGPMFPIANEIYSNSPKNSSNEQSSGESTASLNNMQQSLMRFHVEKTVIFREDGSQTSPTAMFVQKSFRLQPMGFVLSLVLIIMWSVSFVKYSSNRKNYIYHNYDFITNIISDSIGLSNNLTAAVFWPGFVDSLKINFSNLSEKECYSKIVGLYESVYEYVTSLRLDFLVTSKVLVYSNKFLTTQTITHNNRCEALNSIVMSSYNFSASILDDLQHKNDYLVNLSSNINSKLEGLFHCDRFMLLMLFYALIGVVISVSCLILLLNTVKSDLPKKAMEFLGSKERLGLLLLKRSIESWDLFRAIFPIEKGNGNVLEEMENKKKPRMRVAKYPSETVIKASNQSHHIDLKDSKLAISFIGVDDILRPSVFGLMSPFISTSSTSQISSSDMSEGFEFSTGGTPFGAVSSANNSEKDIVIQKESLNGLELVSSAEEMTKKSQLCPLYSITITSVLPWSVLLLLLLAAQIITLQRNILISTKTNMISENYMNLNSMLSSIKSALEPENISYFDFTLTKTLSDYSRGLERLYSVACNLQGPPLSSYVAFMINAVLFFWLVMYSIIQYEKSIVKGIS